LLSQDPGGDPACYMMYSRMRSPMRPPSVESMRKFGNGMIACYTLKPFQGKESVDLLCEKSSTIMARQCNQKIHRHVKDVTKRCLAMFMRVWHGGRLSTLGQCSVKLR
jgi:hypothetical protein